MPNRLHQKIDFTDVLRQGNHPLAYVDGEVIDFLQYHLSPNRTLSFPNISSDGVYTALNLYSPQSKLSGAYYANAAFSSLNILPKRWFIETVVRTPMDSTHATFLSVADFDFNLFRSFSDGGWGAQAPSPFKVVANFQVSSGVETMRIGVRDLLGRVEELYDNPILVSDDVTGLYSVIAYKSDSGIGVAYFKENGQFLNGYALLAAAILNFETYDRFVMGCGAKNSYIGRCRIHSILISEHTKTDLMDSASATVTSDGTRVGAGTYKVVIHDNTELTYIELALNQYIEIDLTGAALDAPIHEIQITCDSTDTNPLKAKLATHAMGGVWSSTVDLGSSSIHPTSKIPMRCIGDKKISSFTNKIRHIFYPEIRFLCGLTTEQTEGCRKIRIENLTATIIKVYEVDVVQSLQEIACHDSTGSNVLFDIDITGADVPIGSTGTVETINVFNTSESDTNSCKVLMIDDGFYDPLWAAVEYSDTAGFVNTYSKLSPPVDPDGIEIVVSPEGDMPFYVRTNLPATGDLFQRFRASFRIKMENV